MHYIHGTLSLSWLMQQFDHVNQFSFGCSQTLVLVRSFSVCIRALLLLLLFLWSLTCIGGAPSTHNTLVCSVKENNPRIGFSHRTTCRCTSIFSVRKLAKKRTALKSRIVLFLAAGRGATHTPPPSQTRKYVTISSYNLLPLRVIVDFLHPDINSYYFIYGVAP